MWCNCMWCNRFAYIFQSYCIISALQAVVKEQLLQSLLSDTFYNPGHFYNLTLFVTPICITSLVIYCLHQSDTIFELQQTSI